MIPDTLHDYFLLFAPTTLLFLLDLRKRSFSWVVGKGTRRITITNRSHNTRNSNRIMYRTVVSSAKASIRIPSERKEASNAGIQLSDFPFDDEEIGMPLFMTPRAPVVERDCRTRLMLETVILAFLGFTAGFSAFQSMISEDTLVPKSKEDEILLNSIMLFKMLGPLVIFSSLSAGWVQVRHGFLRRGEFIIVWPSLIWLGVCAVMYGMS